MLDPRCARRRRPRGAATLGRGAGGRGNELSSFDFGSDDRALAALDGYPAGPPALSELRSAEGVG